jgi:hypothetical protein
MCTESIHYRSKPMEPVYNSSRNEHKPNEIVKQTPKQAEQILPTPNSTKYTPPNFQ